jgi:two-component sensor histidine kinase
MINSLSLRQRIMLLLCLASLPGLAVAVFLANSWLNDQTRQIGVSVERLAKLAAARNETVIENARALLVSVAQGYSGGDLNAASCRTYLTGWLEQFPAFTSLILYNEQGEAVCATTGGEMPLSAGDAAWFNETRAKKTFVLGRYMLAQSGKPLLAAAYPVLDDGERFQGAVALGVDLRWLDFLGKTINLPENATISALNEAGELLSHNAAMALEEGAEPGPPPSQETIRQMIALESGTLRGDDASGSSRVYGVQQTRNGNLVVTVGQTPYLKYVRYGDALLNTLAAPVLVLLLALLAAGYASEAFVTRYVRSLARTAEAIEEGDLSARSEIPYGKYEIGKLAAAFDSMAAAIEQDQIELKNLAEEREVLIRELNHRVKNNLQIVLSMLRPGMDGNIAPEEALVRMKSLAGRVQTLAQIHQLLYQRYNAAPPLASYVQELTSLLSEFYSSAVGPAHVDADVDAAELTIGQCISFGLILNELVANAQKHAFREPNEAARISVRVAMETQHGQDYVHLSVSDNGVGLPKDYDLVDARSTGSRIVRALAQQLNGELWGEHLQPGTAMHMRFPARQRA